MVDFVQWQSSKAHQIQKISKNWHLLIVPCVLKLPTPIVTKPIVTIEDKASLIHYICLHYVLLYALPHVEQFINGLRLYSLLDVIRQFPEKARMLFQSCKENRLNAEIVDELFMIQFSPEGSSKRPQEEAIAFHFTTLLEEIESGAVKGELFDFVTESSTEVVFSLGDILQFVTGCPSMDLSHNL